MKKTGIIVLCLLIAQIAHCQWIEYAHTQAGQNETSAFLQQDKGNFRKNAEGTPFYQTNYRFEIKYPNKEASIELNDNFFIDPENPEMKPAVYVDAESQMVYIFVWEKDEGAMDYGMKGYIYEYDLNKKKYEKKTIFEKANFGWFSYFTKADDGQVFLRHFSYAGGMDMISLDYGNGIWMTFRLKGMRPEEAKERYYKIHDDVYAF